MRGTIIEGTLKLGELIPRFFGVLDAMVEEARLTTNFVEAVGYVETDELINRTVDALTDVEERMETDLSYYESEDAAWDFGLLIETLNEWAEEDYFFGTHPGDGADFGFWKSEEC